MEKCRSVVTASIPVAAGRRNHSGLNLRISMGVPFVRLTIPAQSVAAPEGV